MANAEDVTDTLGTVVLNIMSVKTFEGHRNTYTTLLSTNGLSIIQNPLIRDKILDHYRLYAAIERFENKYSNLIDEVQNYFSLYIDYYDAGKITDEAIVKNIKTKNLLTISAIRIQDGIWRYEESLEKAEELKKNIISVLMK